MVVPAATPESLKAGEQFIVESEPMAQPQIELNEEISPEQIYEIARENVRQSARESGSLDALACSRLKRFLGAVIDTAAACASAIASGIVVAILGAEGGASVLVAALTIPAMLVICQGYMIAVDGRTIGKYCVKSKIVKLNGQPPGFFQGIFMRIIVINLLGIIPFFGLINACWIFQNESKRCLHDYIAGTFVIDA